MIRDRSFVSCAAALLALLPVPAAAQCTSLAVQKLFAPVGSSFQTFGRDIDVQGDVALITANGDTDSGAAYCYRKAGASWVFSQKFKGADTAQGDFFGFVADVDGSWAVIGAPQTDALGTNSGSAYVFQDNGALWGQVQKLTAFDGAAGDKFGWTVAIAGDLIVVGAAGDDDGGTEAGSAYVFRRAGPAWVFEQKLAASTEDAVDQFGWDVDTDGESVIVSSVEDEEPGQGTPGAVFVFRQVGGTWQEVQRFVAPLTASGDGFGWALDLDGDVLAVTATNHDLPFTDGGGLWVYRFDGSTWTLEQKLVPTKLGDGQSLGFSVDLQGDRLVVGAPGIGADISGGLYQFHHDASGWVEVHQWLASDAAVVAFPPPQLGMACALDSKTAFGGAPFHDGAVVNAGAVYRFALTDLGLDAVPDSVPAAGALQLQTWGGLAFAPIALFVKQVEGVTFNMLLLVSTFDAAGRHTLGATVPPALSGLEATFFSFGYWAPGFKSASNDATVSFQ